MAARVNPEAREAGDLRPERDRSRRRRLAEVDDPQPGGTEVSVHVAAGERRQRRIVHHVTADDPVAAERSALAVLRVRISEHGEDDRRGKLIALLRRLCRRLGVDLQPLVTRPAVVGADVLTTVSKIDLLLRALADVADHHVAGGAVEREPPWVA